MNKVPEKARSVYGIPPGADFVEILADFIHDLASGQPPEFMPRMHVLVPSRRMQRRLKTLFEQGGNLLLPRVGLVTDVSHLLPGGPVASAPAGLARILELKKVVSRLVSLDDRLSESDTIDLTISLTNLLDEMQGEAVPFERLENLEPGDVSGHWDQSLSFLRAIRGYLDALSDSMPDPEALHRANVQELSDTWVHHPPTAPVIVAGSTGSRATTRLLMANVSKLDQGKVLLPGFDFDLPAEMWTALLDEPGFEDHPQYRFARFLKDIDVLVDQVTLLGTAADPNRNKLVSLAMRPAPVTDQWLTQGPELGALQPATSGLSLIEAADGKLEAAAIALAIRGELDKKRSVALIAPDATLARRVTAELSRWNILPDDSGGIPLSLTPVGRFLRQTAKVVSGARDTVQIMSLLKHPLTHQGADRGEYMRHTQVFELFLRRRGVAQVDDACLARFEDVEPAATRWVSWLKSALAVTIDKDESSASEIFATHQRCVERFAGNDGLSSLFEDDTGRKIADIWSMFDVSPDQSSDVTFNEYSQLLDLALASDSARVQAGVHHDVMIWGTLEARVQGADVVIIGGLNEGVWPEQQAADPWLNRSMRREVGLLLPERQVGLAAHDFQQAIGAPTVILSRARRVEGSETVPSRWLSRLTNLLAGLAVTGGEQALAEMRSRGKVYLDHADTLDRPQIKIEASARPAPAPPVASRPREFAITEIQRLIRDPYAIYARRILCLAPLNPLGADPDARLKGTVFHKILEKYYHPDASFDNETDAAARLEDIALKELSASVPTDAMRIAWWSQLHRNRTWLFAREQERRRNGTPLETEVAGRYLVPNTIFTLRGTADRIDQLNDGQLVIYDYKTGTPPSRADILRYDRQLVIEALMAEAGAFDAVAARPVSHVAHVGVGRTPSEQFTQLEDENALADMPRKLAELLGAFMQPSKGYMSRRAMEDVRYAGDYDHLARFGEWDDASPVDTRSVGQ